MHKPECWGDLMFTLQCLSKGKAKKQFRNFIRYSFGGLCAYCRERRAITVDHLKPRCRGGSDLRSNLIPCCVECNRSKASEVNWIAWYQRQDFYSKVAEELIEEWINDTRRDLENYDERPVYRAEICTESSSV